MYARAREGALARLPCFASVIDDESVARFACSETPKREAFVMTGNADDDARLIFGSRPVDSSRTPEGIRATLAHDVIPAGACSVVDRELHVISFNLTSRARAIFFAVRGVVLWLRSSMLVICVRVIPA